VELVGDAGSGQPVESVGNHLDAARVAVDRAARHVQLGEPELVQPVRVGELDEVGVGGVVVVATGCLAAVTVADDALDRPRQAWCWPVGAAVSARTVTHCWFSFAVLGGGRHRSIGRELSTATAAVRARRRVAANDASRSAALRRSRRR
jgi:hypothetical protein